MQINNTPHRAKTYRMIHFAVMRVVVSLHNEIFQIPTSRTHETLSLSICLFLLKTKIEKISRNGKCCGHVAGWRDEAEAARSGRCDGCLPPVGAAACAAGRLLRESMGPVPRRAVPGLGDFRAGLSPEKMIPGRGPSLPGRPRDRRISVQHGFVPGIFRSALLTAWPRPSGSFFRQDPLCGQLFPLTGEFPYSTVPGPGTSVRSFPLSGPSLRPVLPLSGPFRLEAMTDCLWQVVPPSDSDATARTTRRVRRRCFVAFNKYM